MSITDLIYLSQKSLRSNILRSILTSLGIIIGVSSVITMISIGSKKPRVPKSNGVLMNSGGLQKI